MADAEVDFKRKDYEDSLKDWGLVEDVCAGERTVKYKKDKYLPRPNPQDKSRENQKRYEQYLLRAVFYPATDRTLTGLVGAVFTESPVLTVDSGLSFIEKDCDGKGVSLDQQAQKVLAAVMKKGRAGLLVDYPKVEGGASKADMQKGGIQANILHVSADQIINWRVERVGGQYRLALVVISEQVEEVKEDGFGTESIDQIRALRLIDGVYTVEIYRSGDKGKWVLHESMIPQTGPGAHWNEIPFTFVGAENNDPDIDPAPLLGLANLNLAHYRNSADYEEGVYMHGQPTLALNIGDMDQDDFDKANPDGAVVGARGGLILGSGGSAQLMQMEANSAAFEAMSHKEKQMVALGARLIEKGSAVKTATQERNENAEEHSVLSLAAANISDAYTKALVWVARFMKSAETGTYELSQEFASLDLDGPTLNGLVALFNTGKWPERDFWNRLRKGGLIDADKSDDEIREELETSNTGLGLDDDGAE